MKGGADDARPALPPHMVDLAKRSSTRLTPEQVAKMEKLLMEYQDVFSRDHGATAVYAPR